MKDMVIDTVELDLYTLKYVKFVFDIHSDFSQQCNGYHSLCKLIEVEEINQIDFKIRTKMCLTCEYRRYLKRKLPCSKCFKKSEYKMSERFK